MISRSQAYLLGKKDEEIIDWLIKGITKLGIIRCVKDRIEGCKDYMLLVTGPREIIRFLWKRRGFDMGKDEEGYYWRYYGKLNWEES